MLAGLEASKNVEIIRQILNRIYNVNASEAKRLYYWVLERFIKHDEIDPVIYLTQRVSELFLKPDIKGNLDMIFAKAINYNRYDILRYLAKTYGSAYGSDISSLLITTIYFGDLQSVKVIVEEFIINFNREVRKNNFDEYIETAVHINKPEIVEYLKNILPLERKKSSFAKKTIGYFLK